MFWSFLRRLLFALFLLWCIPTLTAQSSSPTSTKLDPITQASQSLWASLLDITQSLPQNFNSFTDSLTSQVSKLQDSNTQLANSNKSLMQQNEDLTASVQLSQAQAAISENKSKQLQMDLNVSTAYTIQVEVDLKAAQDDARALAFQKSLTEYVAFAAVGAGAGAVVSKGNLVDAAIGAGAGLLLKAALALTHIF